MGQRMGPLKTRRASSLQASRRAWNDAAPDSKTRQQGRTEKRQLLRGGQAIVFGTQFNLASRFTRGNLAAPL